LQNVGGRLAKGFTMSCKADGAPKPFKEGIPNLLLECPNLLRERWLRDPQFFGRARKAAGPGNSRKITQLPDIHDYNPPRMECLDDAIGLFYFTHRCGAISPMH
jgi:hypothetical protein